MHWWHGAFTSTSKSRSSDDSVIIGDSASRTRKPGFFSSRRSQVLVRARKLMHAAESDVEIWRSPANLRTSPSRSCTPASALPHPLPLPELNVLLHHDPKNASSGLPLPSPEDKEKGRDRERERTEIDELNELKRLVGQDSRMNNTEHSENRPSRKLQQRESAKGISSHVYNINIPTSAPTSPYSSLPHSPPTNDMRATKYMPPLGIFQVWSAPEMPHSDNNNNNNLGSGYFSTSSVDNSPLQSPQRPLSPLTPSITSEIQLARRESNVHVHPLPLPPSSIPPVGSRSDKSGTNMASNHCPLSPVGSIPEVMSMKSQWQKGKLIGRGTYGSVYVASNIETGALCAMKEVDILPDDSKSAECMRQLEQEIKVLRHLEHPNIVQYYGSEIEGDKFYIYLEYVHPGSINKFIQDHCGAITESVVRNFTRHILCGLAYLHSKKTIHRDIKGANLLVDAYGVVKLADFGMAKHLNGQMADLSLKGSPYWMAPELLQSMTQTDASSDIALAVDIWSLGCTIIEMMNGKPPWSEYEGAAALFRVLTESPSIPSTMSAEGQDFLQCCFRRNPADRPTASQLLDHPFVNYSHPPHACTQSLKEIKFTDDLQYIREQTRHTSEQVHVQYDIKHRRLSDKAAAMVTSFQHTAARLQEVLDSGLVGRQPVQVTLQIGPGGIVRP